MDRQKGRDRRASHAERFEHQRRIKPRQAGSARILGHVKPAKAQLCNLGPKVFGDCFVFLPLLGERGDMFLAKAIGHVENRGLLF